MVLRLALSLSKLDSLPHADARHNGTNEIMVNIDSFIKHHSPSAQVLTSGPADRWRTFASR